MTWPPTGPTWRWLRRSSAPPHTWWSTIGPTASSRAACPWCAPRAGGDTTCRNSAGGPSAPSNLSSLGTWRSWRWLGCPTHVGRPKTCRLAWPRRRCRCPRLPPWPQFRSNAVRTKCVARRCRHNWRSGWRCQHDNLSCCSRHLSTRRSAWHTTWCTVRPCTWRSDWKCWQRNGVRTWALWRGASWLAHRDSRHIPTGRKMTSYDARFGRQLATRPKPTHHRRCQRSAVAR